MIESNSKDQVFIRKVTEIILANIQNESFDFKVLAHESGLSHYALRRRLHAITGKTIGQFIRETRLLRALEILREEEITASEVAYKVGFSSPAYFNKCFHELFSYPPGKVIKGDLDGNGVINLVIPSEKKERKKSGLRTIIVISSAILLVVTLVFLVIMYLPETSPQIGVKSAGFTKNQ
jgi:AraC-like DNA-binding protein